MSLLNKKSIKVSGEERANVEYFGQLTKDQYKLIDDVTKDLLKLLEGIFKLLGSIGVDLISIHLDSIYDMVSELKIEGLDVSAKPRIVIGSDVEMNPIFFDLESLKNMPSLAKNRLLLYYSQTAYGLSIYGVYEGKTYGPLIYLNYGVDLVVEITNTREEYFRLLKKMGIDLTIKDSPDVTKVKIAGKLYKRDRYSDEDIAAIANYASALIKAATSFNNNVGTRGSKPKPQVDGNRDNLLQTKF